jgi:hypothetical protein
MEAYTPNDPPADTMFMAANRHCHGSPVQNQSFVKMKIYETLTLTLKIFILQENEFKEWSAK